MGKPIEGIEKPQTRFNVIDQKGNPIQGVEISAGINEEIGVTGITDKDGNAILELAKLRRSKPEIYRHLIGLIRSLLKHE